MASPSGHLRAVAAPTPTSAIPAPLAQEVTEKAPALRPANYSWSIVPHTHWDREWYLPFDHFRIRLARTIDGIIQTLEADPTFRSFTLDGQAVILDDYADLRPAVQVERLRALARAGRLEVGPAYILPDEFLAGGEALIRNLLAGRETCRRHGVEPMTVGYMPDTFGHVAQLPQILRGFGLDTFVFWRGLDDRADELGTAFTWRAADGSDVTAIRQLDGYGNACQLGAWGDDGSDYRELPAQWPAAAAHRFERFLQLHGATVERGPLTHLLLCNGSDHEPIWSPLTRLLDHARHAHQGLDVKVATYGEYVEAVRPQLSGLRVLEGELVAGREAPVLRGINSTRMYLKQANERTERALIVAETLASLAVLKRRYTYPHDELRVAWRELLKNQPHDSISGCSVDEVHRDMAQRYTTASAIAERVRREALAALAGREERWSHRPEVQAAVSIVNPLPFARASLVQVAIPDELLDAGELVLRTRDGPMPAQRAGDTLRLSMVVDGWQAAPIRISTGAERVRMKQPARVGPSGTIENEFYRVRFRPGLGLCVTHKRTGREHTGLHRFEDDADRGDEYNFDPVAGAVTWRASFGRARILSRGPHVAELEATMVADLPERLAVSRARRSPKTVPCEIRTVVRLVAGVDRVEFVTSVDNRARDHRLRVVFPAPAAAEPVRAEAAFAVVRRPARMTWNGSGWAEPPALTAHSGGAVSAGELAVLTKGLPEYEAIPVDDGLELAITLLRCVGWLSRDDLVSRPGHAGPELETPEAQCQGRHTFEYAIRFGELTDVELTNASADYRTGFETGPDGVELEHVLALGGDPVSFSALKGAEDGDGVILRVFNPGSDPAGVRMNRPAHRVRLDETERQPGRQRLSGGAIGTYRLG